MVNFFTEKNSPRFEVLLKIQDRIPAIADAVGLANMGKILMAEITKFVNCYTVVRPMNSDQIAQCAFALISSSNEDYLSLQDLVLFFEGAKQGKYGRVLDHIDQHVIFEMLEVYRQGRHDAYRRIKEEREAQYATSKTALGRSADDTKDEENDIRKIMADYKKQELAKEHSRDKKAV